MDDPAEVGRYIFKIHIPNSVDDRRACLGMLRKMNIHHGSLFPDPIGASLYCNEWFGGRVDEPESSTPQAISSPKRPIKKPLRLRRSSPKGSPTTPSLESAVAAVLRDHDLPSSQTKQLAADLAAKYQSTAPMDWIGKGFGSASVNVEIKRILRMNGLTSEAVEPVAASVLELFESAAKPLEDPA